MKSQINRYFEIFIKKKKSLELQVPGFAVSFFQAENSE